MLVSHDFQQIPLSYVIGAQKMYVIPILCMLRGFDNRISDVRAFAVIEAITILRYDIGMLNDIKVTIFRFLVCQRLNENLYILLSSCHKRN